MQASLGQLLDVPSSGEVGLPLGNQESESYSGQLLVFHIWFDLFKEEPWWLELRNHMSLYRSELEWHDNILVSSSCSGLFGKAWAGYYDDFLQLSLGKGSNCINLACSGAKCSQEPAS